EIYFDITHSFRSLPLIINQLLFYYQDVSPKRVSIKKIFYGMLEMVKELGYAPIIELNYLITLNNYIKGAYDLSNYGNAYIISKLIENEDKSLSNKLTDFSDTLNLGLLYEIDNQIHYIYSIINKDFKLNKLADKIIKPTLREFIPYFPQERKNPYQIQLSLSEWYFIKKNYALSVIILVEAIITYICLKENNLDWQKKENREKCKMKIKQYENINNIYSKYKLNSIRNAIAHNIDKNFSSKKAIKNIKNAINDLKKNLI
ncbi:MAG: CRISPR-associated DxTHG motif protein, partial [Bacteroidales bacterium]|nr:CRISPR-associated DxTHG motif protein [Bacteroidales bacterium]